MDNGGWDTDSSLNADLLVDESIMRATVEGTQRQRGLAARIEIMETELKFLENKDGGDIIVDNAVDMDLVDENARIPEFSVDRLTLKKVYEAEIVRLRREADEVKLRAGEERAKREAEHQETLKELAKLQVSSIDGLRNREQEEAVRKTLDMCNETSILEEEKKHHEDQLQEMAKRTVGVESILEKLSNSSPSDGIEKYIPLENHGVTSVRFHLSHIVDASLEYLDFQGRVTLYVVVKLGDFELHSRAEHEIEADGNLLDEVCKTVWNDTFNFPYLNERYISLTIRALDRRKDQRQYDLLLGGARIDLETFIANPVLCGNQFLQVSLLKLDF